MNTWTVSDPLGNYPFTVRVQAKSETEARRKGRKRLRQKRLSAAAWVGLTSPSTATEGE